MEDQHILRRLNDPWTIGFWTLDVVIPFVVVLMLGFIAGHFWKGAALAFLVAAAISRLKAGKHAAFFIHSVYWYLPSEVMPLKATPPAQYRELIG